MKLPLDCRDMLTFINIYAMRWCSSCNILIQSASGKPTTTTSTTTIIDEKTQKKTYLRSQKLQSLLPCPLFLYPAAGAIHSTAIDSILYLSAPLLQLSPPPPCITAHSTLKKTNNVKRFKVFARHKKPSAKMV